MTAPQLTFALTTGGLSIALSAFFYRGVRRYASSKKESLLASVTAGTLCAVGVGWVIAALVNAIGAA